MARPSYAAAGERPILVVDDEVDVLESTELLLFTLGLRNVVLCADGTRVMRLLDEHDPRLILLDLAMPGVRGRRSWSASGWRGPTSRSWW